MRWHYYKAHLSALGRRPLVQLEEPVSVLQAKRPTAHVKNSSHLYTGSDTVV